MEKQSLITATMNAIERLIAAQKYIPEGEKYSQMSENEADIHKLNELKQILQEMPDDVINYYQTRPQFTLFNYSFIELLAITGEHYLTISNKEKVKIKNMIKEELKKKQKESSSVVKTVWKKYLKTTEHTNTK